MERITCPKCGESAYASEPFCPACGATFGQVQSTGEAAREAVQFGTPVAHPLSGVLLEKLAEALGKGERVLVSLENGEGTVGVAATNRRILVFRSGDVSASFAGTSCKEIPYLSVAEVKQQIVGTVGQLQLIVRTIAGKPEVGVRGRMGKLVPERLAGMPSDRLEGVVAALRKLIAKAEAIQAQREG